MKEALYTSSKQKDRAAQLVNPLVQDGQKLIPSVTRVFSKSKELYVYLQAYQQGDAPPHPLLAYVSFYRDGNKVFETSPVQVVDAEANRLHTMAVRVSLPAEKLDEGEYQCQVSVFDALGKKAAFWQAPIMIVQ
jgi:hypothetical protein